MKTVLSKIRRSLRRFTEKAKITFAVSIGLPGFFKVEIRYTSEITEKAVNDNRRRSWRLRADRRRFVRR